MLYEIETPDIRRIYSAEYASEACALHKDRFPHEEIVSVQSVGCLWVVGEGMCGGGRWPGVNTPYCEKHAREFGGMTPERLSD